jgi:hypothetical protein
LQLLLNKPALARSKSLEYYFIMNTRLFLVGLTGASLLTACGPSKPNTEEMEKEVQRRVEQRLADEQRARQEQELQARQQQLEEREKNLAAREASADRDAATAAEQRRQAEITNAAALRATPEPTQVPEPTALRGVEVTDDQQPAMAQRFYDDLDPYGDWIETRDYGYVFRPTIAVRSGLWRPYEDGRWAYTDDGWAWVSNEPFGWACYHYGRWTRLRGMGWIWVPGSEWAPAWVSWRYGDSYCGWAPLPPEARFGSSVSINFDMAGGYGAVDYTFVPTGSLCEASLRPFIVDRSRNVTIINNTVNVTHIEKTKIVNKTVIVNRGPHIDRVEAVMKKPVPRLKIERETSSRPGAKITGDALQISTPPEPQQLTGPAKPHRVKEKVGHVEVDRSPGTPAVAGTPGPQPGVTATATPGISPLESQRKEIDAEQTPAARPIRDKKQPKHTTIPEVLPTPAPVTTAPATPVPDNAAANAAAEASAREEARRKAVEQEQLRQQRALQDQQIRQQRLEKQQARDEAERQQKAARAAEDAQRDQLRQQELQQRRLEENQARQQRAEELRARQQQDAADRQRAQAERAQELQQRRLEQQQQQQMERQRDAQEAAARAAAQQQREESRKESKESRKRGKQDDKSDQMSN